MGNIKKSSVKYLILEIVSISIAGIILWPLLDYLYHTLLTQSPFNYSVFNHIVEPIIFGCVVGTVYWLFDRKKSQD